MIQEVQKYAKLVAAIIGTAVTAGAGVLLPEAIEWLAFVGALITTLAVYVVPNKTAE